MIEAIDIITSSDTTVCPRPLWTLTHDPYSQRRHRLICIHIPMWTWDGREIVLDLKSESLDP